MDAGVIRGKEEAMTCQMIGHQSARGSFDTMALFSVDFFSNIRYTFASVKLNDICDLV